MQPRPDAPTPNAQVFVPIRDLSKLRMLSVVVGLLAAVALFLGFDLLRMMSGSEENMMLIAGGVLSMLAVGLWITGGVIDPGLMSWVELNAHGLRRVSPHVPTLDIPRHAIRQFVVYVVKVSRGDGYGGVSESADRYELYVDGTVNWQQVALSFVGGDISYEGALKCNAIITGNQESVVRIGTEIAAACGVPFDTTPRPRTPPT